MYIFQRHCFFPLLCLISCLLPEINTLCSNLFCLVPAVIGAAEGGIAVLLCFLLETIVSGVIFSFEAIFKDFLKKDRPAGGGGGRGAVGIFDLDLSCLHFLVSELDESSSDETRFINRFLLMPLPI